MRWALSSIAAAGCALVLSVGGAGGAALAGTPAGAADQPPPFAGFERVPWAKYTNSAFAADFDGKWIRVEAEFVASTSVSPQGLPELARGQGIATPGQVFFTVRPVGGAESDDFAGVFIAKEKSDPLFSMAPGQKLVLYGLGRRLVVATKGPPATSTEYALLEVVQLEVVPDTAPVPAPSAATPTPVPEPAAAEPAPREPREPIILFGTKPQPGAEGVGGVERTVALSLGTGPLPVDTLTLGLTGLAARVMFPKGTLVPFAGLAYDTGRLSTTSNGGGDSSKYRTGATAVTLSGGARIDGGARLSGDVIPYFLAAGMLSHGSVKNGEVDPDESLEETGITAVGALAGFGLDGFVTSHLSLGAELGGAVFTAWGKTKYDGGGANDDEHDEGLVSAYTALQLTVWR
jgi:hypothetical protein